MGEGRPIQLEDAVSLQNGVDAARQPILDVCKKSLPGWEDLTVDDVEVRVAEAHFRCTSCIMVIENPSHAF